MWIEAKEFGIVIPLSFSYINLVLSFIGQECLYIYYFLIESFRAPTFREAGVDKRGFDLGWVQNCREVFGSNFGLALIPVFTRLVPLFFGVCFKYFDSRVVMVPQNSSYSMPVICSLVPNQFVCELKKIYFTFPY